MQDKKMFQILRQITEPLSERAAARRFSASRHAAPHKQAEARLQHQMICGT
jgi:hypothetical protein